MYLSEEDFQKVLNMCLKDFENIPTWKKMDMKKKAGLF